MKKYYPKGYKPITIPDNATKITISTGVTTDVAYVKPECGSFSVKTEGYSFTIDGLWITERDYKYASDATKKTHHETYVVSYETDCGVFPVPNKPTVKCYITGDAIGNNFVSISKKNILTHLPSTNIDLIENQTVKNVYLREKDQFSKLIDFYGETIDFDITFGKLDYTKHPLITNPSGY